MTRPALLAVGTNSPALRTALERYEFTVEETPLSTPPSDLARFTAVILSGPQALEFGQRVSLRPIEDRPMLLYVAPDGSAESRLLGFTRGADAVAPISASSDELAAQIHVFGRWQAARQRWRDRVAAAQHAGQQLQIAYQQIELDLAMARRLQASFLPRTLPAVGAARFGVSYHPCGQVGGDFYDVMRLDEHHVGFYIADAMGHGVPASLLTIFLKKAVQAKEVSAASYRLVPPEVVLARLNRELMGQGLADLPFITMIYGLLDCRSGALQFARAAHPHPIYLPRTGDPQQWQTPGTLLGVFEAEYPAVERVLRPGDKLLLHTDGLSESGHDSGPVMAAALEHRAAPIDEMVQSIADSVLASAQQPDDFTLLGVEMLA